jgi:hypothetical protein
MNDRDNETNIKFATAIIVFVVLYVAGHILISKAWADNQISIDQIGSYNTVVITQDGTAQSAAVVMGKESAADNNYVAITQQGTGNKTAKVEIPSGINNGVSINQDGAGNHYAGIQNLAGTANNISVNQSGAGNHTMAIAGATGSTNSGNTITAEQSGGVGADKSFQLNLNGTTGATVNVQQTNPTTPNSGSMSIQCVTCGTYNYIRQ